MVFTCARRFPNTSRSSRAGSSVDRARRSQRRGQRFDPAPVHHFRSEPPMVRTFAWYERVASSEFIAVQQPPPRFVEQAVWIGARKAALNKPGPLASQNSPRAVVPESFDSETCFLSYCRRARRLAVSTGILPRLAQSRPPRIILARPSVRVSYVLAARNQ